jgi:hypothetical protein
MRSAVVAELVGWVGGGDIDPLVLVDAVERYDVAKGGNR